MSDQDRQHDLDKPAPHGFLTTHWSLILSARDAEGTRAREALASLCSAYWYPLYAFVRRKGHDAESAQDLVQGFFARLLEKGDLASVDRAKGKFRSFLMASSAHFLANQSDHDRAWKRGGGKALISIDRLTAEGRYDREPSHNLTAERLFERRWATTLLENVLGRLESEMDRTGNSSVFEALRPVLLGEAERASYAQIAARLGVSEEAARAAAQRLRRRYRVILREQVAQTLEDPAEVEEEIHSLFFALGD